MNALNAPRSRAWLWNVLLVTGGVVVLNGLIFSLPWFAAGPSPNAAAERFPVPGWLVGSVWTLLFTAFATARWLLNFQQPAAGRARAWVDWLVLACGAYPFYTDGLKSQTIGLAGNIVTLGLALWVGWRAWPHSRLAAGLVWLVVPWLLFASLILVLNGFR